MGPSPLGGRKKGRKGKKEKERGGDHLPPHKYIKNTSTCGTTPTEHLLNAGTRPQTSQKARDSPCTWIGQKKKEKTEIGRASCRERVSSPV